LPGVPTLFRRKFVDIRDRFRTEPITAARVYLDADEGSIATDLDAVVAAFPAVRIGSYPRFAETDFRVMITFEGRVAGDVGAAQRMLIERCGPRVVRHDVPAQITPSE
jgi:molybdopterin-biosynthesis enzyme MoeA-like protein